MWIYHERQEALLCGQHALNNLVQACVFSADGLAQIAHQLDEMELTYMAQNNEGGVRSKDYLKRMAEGSGNVDPSGNFSIEVLRAALMNQYNISLPNIRQKGVGDTVEVTDIEGFICNRESHWFAIRKINARFWNLNSTKERPEIISHFRLAAEIQSLQESGYSVFCVLDELPPPCTTSAGRERGLPQFWWKEADLLAGKSDATTGATDPWRNVGTGMRLDGKPTMNEGDNVSSLQEHMGDLTEEELMQMAVAASLEERSLKPSEERMKVEVQPEPSPTAKGVVRIQFRLPNGGRVIRRFFETELVAVLYAFVEEQCHEAGKSLELRCGFPPKDLNAHREKTLKDAGVSGESIQCRYT